LNVQKPKVLQLYGGFAPWLPDQVLLLWTLLGALPPDFLIGSHYHACHGTMPPPDIAGWNHHWLQLVIFVQ